MKIEEVLNRCQPSRTVIISGVYLIYCTENNRAYIGSSTNVYKRLINHKNRLRASKHGNAYLQAAWSLYGEDQFRFLLLEEKKGSQQDLIDLENTYLLALPRDNLFNLEIPAVLGRSAGFQHTEASRKKLSDSLRGKPHRKHTFSPEARVAQSERMKAMPKPELIAKMHAARQRKGYAGSLSAELKSQIQHEYDTRISELGHRPRGLLAELHRRYGAGSSLQTVIRACLRSSK